MWFIRSDRQAAVAEEKLHTLEQEKAISDSRAAQLQTQLQQSRQETSQLIQDKKRVLDEFNDVADTMTRSMGTLQAENQALQQELLSSTMASSSTSVQKSAALHKRQQQIQTLKRGTLSVLAELRSQVFNFFLPTRQILLAIFGHILPCSVS